MAGYVIANYTIHDPEKYEKYPPLKEKLHQAMIQLIPHFHRCQESLSRIVFTD